MFRIHATALAPFALALPLAAQDVPAQDVPAQDVPAQDVPAQDVPAQDVPAQRPPAPPTDGQTERSVAPAFTSPGMSPYFQLGQTTRFDRAFNPAIGVVIDSFADYLDVDGGDDGYDAELRLVELNASAFIDPDAWAYVALVSEDAEVELEEAAVQYVGLGGGQTVRAGRFFVDFGKQMQNHVEELRTLERPLVLREYLGEELGGVGVQYGNWFPLGDATPLRFSVGVFDSLAPDAHGHGEEEEEEDEVETSVPARKDVDELSLTARLSAMTDVGERGLFQLGASARVLPEFTFASGDVQSDGNGNTVYGIDATYGTSDPTGERRFTTGLEWLVIDGDLAAELDGTALAVVDDTASGFYAFADYAFDRRNSLGVQYSMAELLEAPDEEASELDLYFTRHFTEFRRLRLGVTFGDDGFDDFARVYLQFTAFFGTHSHGLDW